uniref:Uncharacterized protein n=1 Tax=Cucumis melo TaxID=3656 RepID=A0A9I9CWY4_CUCME
MRLRDLGGLNPVRSYKHVFTVTQALRSHVTISERRKKQRPSRGGEAQRGVLS